MNMKKTLSGLALAFAVTGAQAAEVSGTVGFTSDYRSRGISQTSGDAAIQGSLDAAFDNGVYIGAWGSNVDWGDDANLEIDYYIGYGADINDDLSYDVSFNYYTYPGYDAANSDYAEIIAGLYYGDLAATFAFSNDYANLDESAQYVALDYSIAVNDDISVDLHVGHSFGDYWGKADIDDYQDASISVSGSVAGVDLSASYLINNIDSADETDSGAYRNDNALIVAVSRSL